MIDSLSCRVHQTINSVMRALTSKSDAPMTQTDDIVYNVLNVWLYN